jgi:hypothetical protein
MSSAFSDKASPAPPPALPPANPRTAVRRPLLWLLAVVAVGLGVRLGRVNDPLQLDEFGALYAVAEREGVPGYLPSQDKPLLPVPSWRQVRERSVLPYGIANPVPLYHYLLHVTVQGLPVTEWSLRLPSVLAGLGCLVAVYAICQRLGNAEVGLVAAMLVAVDPIQIACSVMARPYALGNLACGLSFLALLGILGARRHRAAALAALGYAVSLALIGYLNPVLLLAGTAHLGMVAYRLTTPAAGLARAPRVLWWLAGCTAGGALLVPELLYIQEVGQFYRLHRDFLVIFGPPRLSSVFTHNSTFLAALLVVSVANAVVRRVRKSQAPLTGGRAGAVAPPAQLAVGLPLEGRPELVWLGRFWLFVPQCAAMLLGFIGRQSVYLSRYLSYTGLGGVLLVAYWATRDRSRWVRWGTATAAVLVTFLWGYLRASTGIGLTTWTGAQPLNQLLGQLELEAFRPGDVVLERPGFLEADLLPDQIRAANRAHVERLMISPLATLYVGQVAKPIIPLSLSHRRSNDLRTDTGAVYRPERMYNEALADRLRRYERFWFISAAWNRREFLACFLPWLADALGCDLDVCVRRPEPGHRLEVYTRVAADDFIDGLYNSRASDFAGLILIQRKRPEWAVKLGALGVSALAPSPGALTVPVWYYGQPRTPRTVEKLLYRALSRSPERDVKPAPPPPLVD